MAACNLNLRSVAWLALLSILILTPSAGEASSVKVRLFPDRVDIGAFFQGVEIALIGEIPAGCEAVVEIEGNAAREELLRKGRRAGLWMTVGEISVENSPSLYLVLSNGPQLPELTGREPPWGFAALKSRITFRGALTATERDRFFQEFLKLKRSEELYATLPGALTISNKPTGQAALQGNFLLPAKVPPGTYQVRLTVVKDGQVVERKSEQLEVRVTGFPALLSSLAYEHEALYGLVAVVIALATGFIMGFLFKGKAEH